MSPLAILHTALDIALSDGSTGERQQALSLVLAQVRDRFSPGEFRHALRQVWPAPLTEKSMGEEIVAEAMSEGLAAYRATGDATDLVKWVDRYLEGFNRPTRGGVETPGARVLVGRSSP